MEEITRFVMLAQSDRFTLTELCEQFGISRKTGYKHLERYAADGLKGLAARSHRPHHFPQLTDEVVEALIVEERRLHRTWGPKKLHKMLGSGRRGRVLTLDKLYRRAPLADGGEAQLRQGYGGHGRRRHPR
jgi:transposase